jgi:hypothetical protein
MAGENILITQTIEYFILWGIRTGRREQEWIIKKIVFIARSGRVQFDHLGNYGDCQAGANSADEALSVKDKLVSHLVFMVAGIFIFISQEIYHSSFDFEQLTLLTAINGIKLVQRNTNHLYSAIYIIDVR